MSKATRDLIRLVEKTAGENGSAAAAYKLIENDADLTASIRTGSLIDSVIVEESRCRQIIPWKADNCLRLIQVLQKAASEQLAAGVLSAAGEDLKRMEALVKVKADCYQSEKYGPLGLLGWLLQQEAIPVQRQVVQLLVEGAPLKKDILTVVDEHQQTCLSVARNNSQCPPDVTDYLQEQLDELFCRLPITQPQMGPDEVTAWVKRGARLEATDPDGNTVLTNAVTANNLELVRALVSAGSSTNHKNRADFTPLQIAKRAMPRNLPLITIMEGQSVNADLESLIRTRKSQLTAGEVQRLLEGGANINAKMANGDSFLHILIKSQGTPEMLTTFVNGFNADLSATNNEGQRPVETCVLLDAEPCTRLLTFFKLSKTTTDTFIDSTLKKTLLGVAIANERLEAVTHIREELNVRLWACAKRASNSEDNTLTLIDEMKQLIAAGADINLKHDDKEYSGWTVLHLACKATAQGFVQYLIDNFKANYMLRNSNGDYPISIAAEYGHLPIVRYLRRLPNSNLNDVNSEKQSPLHLATKNHHLLVVRYLVRWGADHQALNSAKQTPLNIAKSSNFSSKEDELSGKELIQFLEQLICQSNVSSAPQSSTVEKPNYDVDMCQVVKPIKINPVKISTDDAEGQLGIPSRGLFAVNPNNLLHDAAKRGAVFEARNAIIEGADIRHRKGNRTAFEVAQAAVEDYTSRLKSLSVRAADAPHLHMMRDGCLQIIDTIRQVAQKKLVEAIDRSDAGLVKAYHLVGAQLTVSLLQRTCQTSGNVEIVDYFMSTDAEIYRAVMQDSSADSLYHIARQKKFNNVMAYLRYQLSDRCTQAVSENDHDTVRRLIRAGASVNIQGSDNLSIALQHKNVPLIRLLCKNGVTLPEEWLTAESIVLPSIAAQHYKPEILLCINRCLIDRRLRFAAASGDLDTVIRCQRLGADIDSTNCHGSTALLYTILYGNSFPIVHALISCGASMLHSNDKEPMSLVDIAEERSNNEIAGYLRKELNVQFLSAVVNNDRPSVEKFAQLGADFNFRDEQQRTALHYATQKHGVDLVTLLCECGSKPNVPDVNGDYPIMLATKRGDYPIVEFFVTKHPATKKQTNRAGQTALELAQELHFAPIAKLIETGMSVPESTKDQGVTADVPKYSKEKLLEAVRNSRIEIIKEFIKERYKSKEQKRKLCYELMQVAKDANQLELFHLLKPHYDTELQTEIASDMASGSPVMLSEHYKKILYGFLSGLNSIIANSSVVLDPSDPNTYVELFSSLTDNVAKTSQQLQQVNSDQDAIHLIEQDSARSTEQLAQISEQLEELIENRKKLEKRIQDVDERLNQQEKPVSASQRKTMAEEREVCKKQLASFECSIFVFERQQEATTKRKNTINFIKDSPNLIMFYGTIENRLQALFHSILVEQGGHDRRAHRSKSVTAGKLSSVLPTSIPMANFVLKSIKAVLSPVLSKLDEKEQKKEWQNISTLGNIEELNRVASDTATLLTLYYREQVEAIDSSEKVRGWNIFNREIHWLQAVFVDMRSEDSEATGVVMTAEYVTAWVIEALRAGKREIIPSEPLPHQLWLHAAKADTINQRSAASVISASAGQQPIRLKTRDKLSESGSRAIQIRYLIGCASVLGNDDEVYQYPVAKDRPDDQVQDLADFGYVFVTPFSSSERALQAIVEGRRLVKGIRDERGDIQTRFKDIYQHAQVYPYQENESAAQSSMTIEAANQVAQVLREQKSFVDPGDLKEKLKTSEGNIKLNVDELSEKLQEKATFYQTSIDAAYEQIKLESIENRKAMEKDNEKHYKQVLEKLNGNLGDIEKHLEQVVHKRLQVIEEELKVKTRQLLQTVDEAHAQSLEAIAIANQAEKTSQQAVQQATRASNYAQDLVQSTEQRKEELQAAADSCEAAVKETTAAQRDYYERMMSEMYTRFKVDADDAKKAVRMSAEKATESVQAARQLRTEVQDIQQMTRSQLQTQKRESERVCAEAKEMREQCNRALSEAREAEQQAKRSADASVAANQKIMRLSEKVDKAIGRVKRTENE